MYAGKPRHLIWGETGALLCNPRGANAIIQAAKLGVAIDGATMYCTHQPCAICAKMIVNAGIIRVVYKHPYPDDFAKKIFDSVEIQIEQYK